MSRKVFAAVGKHHLTSLATTALRLWPFVSTGDERGKSPKSCPKLRSNSSTILLLRGQDPAILSAVG